MEPVDLSTTAKNERLAIIVERCLASPAAYQLFDILSSISQLDLEDKLEYMELVKESGAYTDEEIYALERLILSGAAHYLMEVIDQVRDEKIQREIDEMLVPSL